MSSQPPETSRSSRASREITGRCDAVGPRTVRTTTEAAGAGSGSTWMEMPSQAESLTSLQDRGHGPRGVQSVHRRTGTLMSVDAGSEAVGAKVAIRTVLVRRPAALSAPREPAINVLHHHEMASRLASIRQSDPCVRARHLASHSSSLKTHRSTRVHRCSVLHGRSSRRCPRTPGSRLSPCPRCRARVAQRWCGVEVRDASTVARHRSGRRWRRGGPSRRPCRTVVPNEDDVEPPGLSDPARTLFGRGARSELPALWWRPPDPSTVVGP